MTHWILIPLLQLPASPNPTDLPPLQRLEQMLIAAPDLQSLELESERTLRQENWWNSIRVSANYSQTYNSPFPLLPSEDGRIIGGTSVGISLSLPLGRLLGRPGPQEIEARKRLLEYRQLHERKLAGLRVLHHRRAQLLRGLESLKVRQHTARLRLEQVRHELQAVLENPGSATVPPPTDTDPIEQAEAEEQVARLESERSQTLLEIEILETQIWELLGKGAEQPGGRP